MKKLSPVAKISCLIFLLISLFTVILARPLYVQLDKKVGIYTQELCNVITDKTGLYLTYDSFSPSIFSYFSIKGIKLTDTDQKVLLQISKTKVNYKLLGLFKGDISSFIRSATIDGVTLDVDYLVDIIISLTESIPKKNTNHASGKKEFDITSITTFIPANVNVKNFYVEYENPEVKANITIKDFQVMNSSRKGAVDFQLDCSANCWERNEHFSTGLYINGSLLKNIDNSYAYIKATNLTNGTFTFNKMNFIATYKDYKIDLHTIQSVYPFEASMVYDGIEQTISAAVKTENLNPINVLSISGYKDLVNELKKSRVTINADFKWEYEGNKMVYNGIGHLDVPKYFIPGGAGADFDLTGDARHLYMREMNIKGPLCNASFDLDFVYLPLQLSGYMDIPRFELPNGTEVSTELYFDPLDKGFQVFSPQIFAGNSYLTAMQAKFMPRNDSFDFEFEVSDYSNATVSEPGVIVLDGSYIYSSHYVQSNVSLNSIYLGSVFGITSELVNSDRSQAFKNLSKTFSPYMFSCDAYVSSDLSSLSYNIPTLVIANTSADNQMALLSINGNEESLQLNRFNLIWGKYAINTTASVDLNYDTKDLFFVLDTATASIPYHISGAMISDVLTVSGDYGTDVEVRFSKDANFSGHAYFDSFPIKYNDITVVFSAGTHFVYDYNDGPSVQIERFECEATNALDLINPKLSLSGDVTRYGAQISSVSYTDRYSSLTGNSDITLNLNDRVFDSAGVRLSLKDTVSKESVNFDFNVSNPDGVPLSGENILKSLYISALLETNHFSLNRFLAIKNDNNEVSASASLSGTLEHPYAVINVDKASFLLMNDLANAHGTILLEDRDLTIENFNFNYPSWNVMDLNGNASLTDFTGNFEAIFETTGENNFVIPLKLKIEDTDFSLKNKTLENAVLTIASDQLSGTLVKNPMAFSLTCIYTPEMISFFSSENLGLMGVFAKDYGLEANLNTGDFISVSASGSLGKGEKVLELSKIHVDLNKLCSFFNFEKIFAIDSGILNGSLILNGDFDTPDFQGGLKIENLLLKLPQYLRENIYTNKIEITAKNNELQMPETTLYIKNVQKAKASSMIYLNKWNIDRLLIDVYTLKNQLLPLSFSNNMLSVSGDVSCDLDMIFENSVFEINGKVSGEKLDISSDIQKVSSTVAEAGDADKKGSSIGVRTNLSVVLGTHVMLNFNPLLRCIFVPNTNANIVIDSQSGLYQVAGYLNLKSGDVAYLNRSFYIKEGSIKFNPTEISNPQVTLTAETREKDDNGQTVRIILSAENQYISDFNPRFSSIPAKSEQQIMSMLGQIVLADSSNVGNLLLSAGDYYFQSTLVRNMENKLRDLMNFDIFSVRTNILQNTLNMGVSGKLTNENISIGNFLDNSTVYIGKYLGSALYVDAMLHLSLEDGNVNDITSAKGLLFKPEFGLEMELPIANIRWNMAPDINAMLNRQYIPSTSVSLSWKFSF